MTMQTGQKPMPRLVGTIHLPPLPGSARGGAGGMQAVLERARRDAAAYAEGGFDAVMVENFGDVPFARDHVGPHVVAAMTLAVAAVREACGLPVGVNVLRNDVLAAVSIAAVAGAEFVRANVYVGVMVTDQGVIEGRAEEVQALIARLGPDIQVWADIDVKHAAALAPRPVGDLAEDAVERGLAAAVIVTGRATGQPASLADLEAVRAAVPVAPIYVGSGATAETLPALLRIATGAIIGTAAKIDALVTNPVDPARLTALVRAANSSRR
ncbi:MAG: BtpA/SgcQ family protein [Thermomicrobiales bacterium]